MQYFRLIATVAAEIRRLYLKHTEKLEDLD